MTRNFFKVPSNELDKILFAIYVSSIISEEPLNGEEIIEIIKKEGFTIDEEVKSKLMEIFQIVI